MTRTAALLAATRVAAVAAMLILTLGAAGSAYAMCLVWDEGKWPTSWPGQLEPLRKQARTLERPETAHRHYAIRFTKPEEFTSAWPHLLKVKSKGAPVLLVRGPNSFLLVRGPNSFLDENARAGVVVHTPPVGQARNPATAEAPINSTNVRERWMYTTYIELVVDGNMIDLNRVSVPADTPIVDERFTGTGTHGRGEQSKINSPISVSSQGTGRERGTDRLTLVTVSNAQAARASGPDFSALRAAVEAFNAQSLSTPIGKDQPPLSVEEVVAAIRLMERTEHPAASDALFGSLQRIATTGKLPPGAELEVLTGLDRGGAFLFDVWYVRMMLPKDDGGTYSFPIRNRIIRSRPVGEVARELEKRLRAIPPLPGRYRLEERLKELKARAAQLRQGLNAT